MKLSGISVVILTFNEERHIERCIRSVTGVATDIFVVDSFSTDATTSIADSLGAKVYQNSWVNYATQFNWALATLPIKTDWVFRLDADEIIDDNLGSVLKNLTGYIDPGVTGIYVKRKIIFLGQWIKHGGMYPVQTLRIFRYGAAFCEMRWMDEHIKITMGRTISLAGNVVDNNFNNIGWWITKHNGYATREAIDILNFRYGFMAYDGVEPRITGNQVQRKRWLKTRYASLPLFVRPFVYFLYRYVVRFGFLDGVRGLIWHFLQGFWYRFLVDVKIYEIFINSGRTKEGIKLFLKDAYGISLE